MRPKPKSVDERIAANRRINLKAIIDSCGGNQRAGNVVGWGAAFISHLKTGCSPFTDRSARRIEMAFRLPTRWLDETHDNTAIPFGSAQPAISTTDVLKAIADVAKEHKLEPRLDKLTAIATLVAEDAAKKHGVIDPVHVRALIALSSLKA